MNTIKMIRVLIIMKRIDLFKKILDNYYIITSFILKG
jgi:hypothetical protein